LSNNSNLLNKQKYDSPNFKQNTTSENDEEVIFTNDAIKNRKGNNLNLRLIHDLNEIPLKTQISFNIHSSLIKKLKVESDNSNICSIKESFQTEMKNEENNVEIKRREFILIIQKMQLIQIVFQINSI